MKCARVAIVMLLTLGCQSPKSHAARTNAATEDDLTEPVTNARADERELMVEEQIAARGVSNSALLRAMREVPRHEFMPREVQWRAYHDSPAPIGHRQTISQPYIVAVMTEQLMLSKGAKVLEIGTGSGYQAAVLSALGAEVYSIEIVCPLADSARQTLDRLGYAATTKCGDGYAGWPDHAPFDAVIVTAAPPEIPQALIDQLAPGGRLIAPEGEEYQQLVLVEKSADGATTRRTLFPVQFVPMVREPGHSEE